MSLYEVVEFSFVKALFQNSNELLVGKDTICLVSGQHVHLLKLVEDDLSSSTSIEFDNEIVTAGISEDGSFLVTGDNAGALHFVSTSLELLFHSQDLLASEEDHKSIEFSTIREGCCRLFVLSSSGTLYIFSNFQIQALWEGLETGDVSCVKEVKSAMVLQQLDLCSSHSLVFGIATCSDDVIVSHGSDPKGLCVWFTNTDGNISLFDEVTQMLKGVVITKCNVTSDGSLLVALTDSSVLTVWLVEMLVMVNVLSGKKVSQFGVLSCGDDQQDLLSCVTGSSMCQALEILTLPTLSSVYSVTVGGAIILSRGWLKEGSVCFAVAPGSDDVQSNVLGSSASDCPSDVVIKRLVLTRPEDKLSKLLSQHRFTEAFQFALKYGLDAELIHKKKAEVVNNLLCREETDGGIEKHQLDLINTLNEINDKAFVCDLILDSGYFSLECTRKLLLYAKDKINKSQKSQRYTQKLYSVLNRLVTYQLINHGQYSCSSWRSFRGGNLLSFLASYVQQGLLHNAMAMWGRHEIELVSQIDNSRLISLIQSLPESVQSADLGIWLKSDILPCVLCHFPEVLASFTSWVKDRVKRLELTEKALWPSNALQLLDIVIVSLHSNRKWEDQLGIQAKQCMSRLKVNQSPSVSTLQDLQRQLQDLGYTKSQLGLTIPFAEYSKETHETMIFKLLDKALAAEVIPGMIKTKVAPYTKHHSLSLDQVLVHYIKHMIVRVPELTPDSLWEAKGVIVVQSIIDRKLYVEGCIELLRGVRTHWSASVEGLVQDCLLVQHSRVEDLKKEYDLLKLKRMLFEYGVSDFNYSYSSLSIAWTYIRYVLKQKGDAVLQDALKIAEMYSLKKRKVYMLHLVNLGTANQLWEISSVLSSLDGEDAIAVAMDTVWLMTTKLESGFEQAKDCVDQWKSTVRTSIQCLKHLKRQRVEVTDEGETVDNLLSILRKLLLLQEEFGVYLTPCSLQSSSLCEGLLQERLSAVLSSSTNVTKMLRFGKLLGYSDLDLQLRLASAYLQKDSLQEARTLASIETSEMWSEKKFYAEGLVAMVLRVWQLLKEDVDCVSREDIRWMECLSARAVVSTSSDQLLHCLQLHSLCYLLKWVWSQYAGDFDAEKRFSSVIDSNRFKEDGLILETSIFSSLLDYCQKRLDYVTHGLKSHVSTLKSSASHVIRQSRVVAAASEEDTTPLFIKTACRLINTFQENGHCQLAISIVLQTILVDDFIFSLSGSHTHKGGEVVGMDSVIDLRSTLTTKVLTARKLDHMYGLALLLLAPAEDGVRKISECRTHSLSSYSRVKAFCNLAVDYGLLTGQLELVSTSRYYYKAADWGKKLREYQISFTQAFRGGENEKRKILNKMFENQSIPLPVIHDYCRDFSFDKKEVFMGYIRIMLTLWSEEYHDRLMEVVKIVGDFKSVAVLLNQILTRRVSPYNYDKIGLVLSILDTHKTALPWDVGQALRLLQCLKRHSRQGPVSSVEKKWIKKWKDYTKVSVEEENPEGSETCLPFHPLFFEDSSIKMTILSTELTRESLSKLIPICTILQIPPDDVIEESIVYVMTNWPASAERNASFSDFSSLLACMESPIKAMGVAKWMAAELGKLDLKESVLALEAAVEIAKKWKKQCGEQEIQEAEKFLAEFKRFLKIKQTEQILQEYGVFEEEFTILSGQPVQLLMKMYDQLTTKRTQVTQVHDLASHVSSIWNLNVRKIRLKLAEDWLPVSKLANKDMDVTQLSMMEDPTAHNDEDEDYEDEEEGEEDITLRRLSYLFNLPTEIKESCTYLINWAQTPKVVGGAFSRIRALQVLFSVASVPVIESISGSKINTVKEFTQTILFISELEDIHLKMSIAGFQNCNKEGLVRTLWKNHSHEPRAVRLVCELCLYYDIHDHMLWNKLLEQLVQLHMIPYMRYVLKKLSLSPLIYMIPGINQIWYSAVMMPLKEASLPPTPFQIRECSKSMKLLNICPFVCDLEVAKVAHAFQAIGMNEHMINCVHLFSNTEKQKELLEKLVGDVTAKERDLLL